MAVMGRESGRVPGAGDFGELEICPVEEGGSARRNLDH